MVGRVVGALCAAALCFAGAASAQERAAIPDFVPPEDGNWPMAAKDFASTRFSGLDQINATTVKGLTVAFTFSTAVLRGQEAAPVFVNDTMYVVTPYPNKVFALDFTKPGAPVKWTYEPKPAAAAQGVACCDTVNRGVDLGVSSWPPDAWRMGGGTVWGWISYDPELDLIVYGTANPGPWNAEQRPGDNKWTAGVFARRPDDGRARWFYQYSPHDLSDYGGGRSATRTRRTPAAASTPPTRSTCRSARASGSS